MSSYWEMLVRKFLRKSRSFLNETTSDYRNATTVSDESQDEVPKDYSDLMTNHTDWKELLPADKQQIVWKSASLSFLLDERTGKNCFMVGAEALSISDEVANKMIYYKKSRFSEVCQVEDYAELGIRGSIDIQRLSPNTCYGAYLVFCVKPSSKLVQYRILKEVGGSLYIRHRGTNKISEFVVGKGTGDNNGNDDEDNDDYNALLYEDLVESSVEGLIRFPNGNTKKLSPNGHVIERGDGWIDVEIGSFYIDENSRSGDVEVLLTWSLEYASSDELNNNSILIEGLEFRPTEEGPNVVHDDSVSWLKFTKTSVLIGLGLIPLILLFRKLKSG